MNRDEFNALFYEFYRTYWGDKRGIVAPGVNLQRQVIDLSVARNGEELRVDGDFLYADPLSTGLARVAYGPAMPPFPFRASTGIKGFPFKTLLLSNDAQPGLVLNLWYGYGAQIIPPNQDIANIGSITNPVSLAPADARYFTFGDYETEQLQAYIAGNVTAPVAAQISVHQLFNPAASGFNLYLDRIRFGSPTGLDRYRILSHNVALVALVTTGQNNKLMNGAAGVAQHRMGTSVAAVGTLLATHVCLASNEIEMEFKSPLIVPEGRGVHIEAFTVNQAMTAHFEWREKPV